MSANPVPIALFRLGRIVVTPNALARLSTEEITQAIRRHQAGDWGDVNEQDRQVNNLALEQGARLVSLYQSIQGVKLQVITEAGRSVTTILLAEDY